jgi:hypothetical protein
LIAPNSEHILADKFWLLSSNIDEMRLGKNVDIENFFQAYKNILLLDSSFEIAIIYSSTYLASNLNRGDLAIELLQIAQKLNPSSFQYAFTELIFQIVYINNNDIKKLKLLANKIVKMPNRQKYIGKIDVNNWANDIITYLNQNSIKKEIQEVDKSWLKSIKD